MLEPRTICLDRAAVHVDVDPGAEIIVSGSFRSKHDGTTIDSATTTWPAEAPGGASVDSGGLLDFAGGGFHISELDSARHIVKAIATGEEAPACVAAGVEAPCLPPRLLPQARSRLLMVADWKDSLMGGSPPGCFTLEVPSTRLPPVSPEGQRHLELVGGVLAVAAVAGLAWVTHRRRAVSPEGQLRALARRVRAKLEIADSVLAAPLKPAIGSALRALDERRVDASSTEGKRVMNVLCRVDTQIDVSVAQARAEQEQAAADELVCEVESALEAANEASALDRSFNRQRSPTLDSK